MWVTPTNKLFFLSFSASVYGPRLRLVAAHFIIIFYFFIFSLLSSQSFGLGFSFGTTAPRPTCESSTGILLGDAALGALFYALVLLPRPWSLQPPGLRLS